MPAQLRRRNAMAAFLRAFMPGTSPGVFRRLAAIPRMVKATLKGQYDAGFRLLLMALAAIYIASPIDLVPELILGPVGLVDDAFVTTWLIGTLLSETERFLEWEKTREGQVVRSEITRR